MSAKPPILPPKPIAGLKPSVTQAPPKSPPKVPEKKVSPNGDKLLESQEFMLGVVPRRHVMDLLERTDPSQFFRFLAQCSCGFEARHKTEVQIRQAADAHIRAHSV